MLCYLNTSASRHLYQQTISLIQMYAHHNQGKRSVEKESEEEQFRDILLMMELLTSILSKDFIGKDFGTFCQYYLFTDVKYGKYLFLHYVMRYTQSSIYPKFHIFKISFFTKFAFLKSHFSPNSHFQNFIFHKIHIF